MSLSDPIGDMLARIKNAQVRNHSKVSLPSSKFKAKIADVLKSEGYIIDYKVNEDKKPSIEINLKYNSGNPVINTIERVSKPGRRIFSSASRNFFHLIGTYSPSHVQPGTRSNRMVCE